MKTRLLAGVIGLAIVLPLILWSNPIGLVFGYVLFSQAMFNGSHLGGVFNLIFWYISLLVTTMVLSYVFRRVSKAQQEELAAGPTEPQSALL